MSVGGDADVRELRPRRERRDVRERVDPSRDALQRLRIEADDQVGQIGGARRAGETLRRVRRRRPARSTASRPRARSRSPSVAPGAAGAAVPADLRRRTLIRRDAADRARGTGRRLARRHPPRRPAGRRCSRSTRSAIAAASGSWVTITTARSARGCAAARARRPRSRRRGCPSARRRARARDR